MRPGKDVDILFVEGHPVLWAGPVDNWVAACDQILAWDVETVVPGHGPITDKTGVQAMKDYLLGANASRVVRHARCSVFVVRPPA